MSIQKVVMPQMGESITNGTITKWHKQVGDTIEVDDILLEISTDKVESEIPSPYGGVIAKLMGKEGDTIDVGVVICEIETDANAAATATKPAAAPIVAATPVEAAAPAAAPVEANPGPNATNERVFYTPLVKAMCSELGVDLSELKSLQGSGSGGRVNKDDLLQYVEKKKGTVTSQAPVTPTPTPSVPMGRVEVIPMDNLRKTIARNMVASKQISPHVNSIAEVDMSHLVRYRELIKDEFLRQEGFKLTYTPFIVFCIIKALKEFPQVNASIEGDNIILKKDINIGIAVAIPGNGLVVPVIKEADNLNLLGLCRMIDTIAKKARAKKLTLDDLQGGTFTFTNVGSFGTLLATPVILQPQLGIYASGVIQKRVVVLDDDSIAVRSMMYGTHTYDHRLIDGEQGGKFLEAVHQHLRNLRPETLF